MDSSNYVAPTGRGTFTVVVNGRPVGEFNDQNQAENAYNANQAGQTPGATVAGGANPPVVAGTDAAGTPTYQTPNGPRTIDQMRAELQAAGYDGPTDGYSVQQAYMQTVGGGGGGGSYGGGGGDSFYNPGAASAASSLAQAAAQQAYLNARLKMLEIPQMQQLDEREKQRIALEAARDAFNQRFQQETASGYMQPEAGQGAAARAQAAFMALPPERRTAQTAAAIWQAQNPGMSPQEAAQMAQAGHDYYATTGQVMPDDVAQQRLGQITGGRMTGQAPTLAREQMNVNAMQAMLGLQSQLRGPGDWVQYMQTVASVPPELRNVINQAAGQFSLPTAQPGAASVAGLVGDLNRGAGVYAGQPSTPAGGGTVQMFGAGAGAGMRTAQAGTAPVPGGGLGPVAQQQGAVYPGAAPGSAVAGRATEQMPAYGPRTTQPSAFYPSQPGAGLPLANQLPRSFATASPDVQDMILSPYEAAGQSKRQVVYDFEKSLPAYSGPTRGVVRY